jgi:hypothetical protein
VPLTNGAYAGKTVDAQIQDIRNQLWYLNIHTTLFGGGETRGQVCRPARASIGWSIRKRPFASIRIHERPGFFPVSFFAARSR